MQLFYGFGTEFPAYGFDKKGAFLQIEECVAVLKDFDPSALAHFWFNRAEKFPLYDLVASTNVSNYRTLDGEFPNIKSCLTTDGAFLRPGMKVVVLSARSTADAEAPRNLRMCNVSANLLVERLIDGPAGPFRLMLFKLD